MKFEEIALKPSFFIISLRTVDFSSRVKTSMKSKFSNENSLVNKEDTLFIIKTIDKVLKGINQKIIEEGLDT